MIKVIVITGPTAVGKTKLAVEIAKYLKTDIINGDAFQIYQKMDIGTAKPSPEIRAQIKHHLCDFWIRSILIPFTNTKKTCGV